MNDEQVSSALLKILNLGEPTDFSLESEIEDEEVDAESFSDGLDEPTTTSFPHQFQDGVEERIRSTYGSSDEGTDVAKNYASLGTGYLN